MSRIAWTAVGSRYYEAGVDRGVLYIDSSAGVPWVGLISVDENPGGGESRAFYIDGVKYLNLATIEEFEATIKAYTYPIEFSQCDGTARIRNGLYFGQQLRKSFGFSYRTMVGNDVSGAPYAYKIHLVYNALATPSPRSATSYGESPEAYEFSWNLTTKPRSASGISPTAHIIIDSRYTHPVTLAAVEDVLYGSSSEVARLLSPEDLITIFDTPVAWEVTDNGDGTFLVAGPEENVMDIGFGMVTIDHPSVNDTFTEDSFTITY